MNTIMKKTFSRHNAAFLFAALFGLNSGHALAAELDLTNIPLEVQQGVPANIILTMDDSGSMAWAFLPDDRDDGSNEDNDRYKSSVWNKIYYNPNITYLPGVDKDGAALTNATFTAAWHNAYNTGAGTVDLSDSYEVNVGRTSTTGGATNAFYYVFDTSKTTGGSACDINNTTHTDTTDDCYTLVDVVSTDNSYTGSAERTDCVAAPTCTFAEESQNFANWYSYYGRRHLLAKTATSRAFAGLSTDIRVAWQELNNLTNIGDTLPFGGTHREDFYTWLFGAPTSGGTPLTDATERAGEKYKLDSVYREDPTDNSSTMHSCRQNFHFTFSDGYWNSSSTAIGNFDNQTRTLPPSTSQFGTMTYEPQTSQVADKPSPIYRDGNSNFLADIAFKYWATDLNTNLDNNVPHFITDISTDVDGDGDVDDFDIFWNPRNDPAEWQHMVNFNVGLGIDGVLNFQGTTTSGTTYDNLLDGTTAWPTAGTSGNNHHVDDLWHAAINSRGGYFSAASPQRLVDSFTGVLDAIDEREGSSSAVATTSSQYQAGTRIFQAIYDTGTWRGDVVALDVTNTLLQYWSAEANIASQVTADTRQILTFDPDLSNYGTGIPFKWANLNATQKAALNDLKGTPDTLGDERLDYLRGVKTLELQNGGTFRNRNAALGDITHSDPIFVPTPGEPLFLYPDTIESVSYSSYVATHTNRAEMLMYGANDGMVHIHDATTGREMLAYVPNKVIKNLSNLTDPLYTHQFYVDEPISFFDVFYNGAWHTVAIGGLGKGGQGLFALDISNPASFGEANASNIGMWEFTDEDDADLGYTYTKPYMMKMNNGKWMVGFSNGHNATEADGNASTTGDAMLFLIDVEHGGHSPDGGATAGLKIKLSTEFGAAEDPLSAGRPNRLTNIVGVDKNNDYMVDFIWAADLFGNVWKFDVTDSEPSNWTIFKQGTTPEPLFVATDSSGNAQPITYGPVVQFHQQRDGFMVYVGTGKYVETADPGDNSQQSFYAVWDREETNLNTIFPKHLLEQEMLGTSVQFVPFSLARQTSNNPLNWRTSPGVPTGPGPFTEYLGWRIDFGGPDEFSNPILGERLDGEILIFANRVEFQTLVPDVDPCVGGGTSWLFALNATTGSRFLTNSPWDYNNDGVIDDNDKVEWGGTGNYVWGSGIALGNKKYFRRTKLLDPSACQEVNILNQADGAISSVTGSCSSQEVGRRSWRQIPIQ